MKCQKCGINEASTHIKKVINGNVSERHLCASCAKEEGITYNGVFPDIHSEFESLLGTFFGNALPARTGTAHCRTCGSTYAEIAQTGRVGCADCYSEFYDSLLPSIRRIHGNTAHCGKRAKTTSARAGESRARTVEQMQKELEEAVKEQNFERAAELRDKIKEMNKNA